MNETTRRTRAAGSIVDSRAARVTKEAQERDMNNVNLRNTSRVTGGHYK